MYKIERVEIDGFWGSFKLRADLHEDVNIFIGLNGSGKTTFMNFLEAVLTADLELLGSLDFREVRLFLRNVKDRRRRKRVIVTRIPEITTYDKLDFQIGTLSFKLPLLPIREREYKRGRIQPSYTEVLSEVKSSLDELVKVSWLSVHREILEDEYRDPYPRRAMPEKNPIDRRITDLINRFTRYQVQLQSKLNELSGEFQRNVLASMLYSGTFDRWISDAIVVRPNLETLKKGLMRTYKDLGALDSDIEQQIDGHVQALAKSFNKIEQVRKGGKGQLTIDDVLPISLMRRTQYVIDRSTELEKRRKELFQPANTYLETLIEFASDKSFQLDPSLGGQLQVSKGMTPLTLEQLSSGEKQLFILLTEALLQRGEPYIYIADEPELSLHIEWQKKVLSTLRTLNSSSQIIVATHAPEIAADWKSKMTRMEDIIHA